MSDLTALTIAEIRDGLAARAFSASELARAYIAAIEAARSLNAYIVETPEKALSMAAESDRRIAAGEARRLEGVPLGIKDLFCTDRHPQPGREPHPRRLQAGLRIDRHRQSLGRWRRHARQAQHGRVRHGLVQRDLLLRPGGQSLAGARLQRAARTRRLVGRLGGGGGGASLRRRRPRPIPAARSASRRLSPAPSASSRPMAAVRAGASSRSPPRSTRQGRSHAPCAMPRSCSARWRASTRRTPRRRTSRCPTTRRRSARA